VSAIGDGGLRLLFDAELSWRVAAALRFLGVDASHVGHADSGAPSGNPSDDELLRHAERAGQVVVTASGDMVLLCAERELPLVWLDPHGRPFTDAELVPVVFGQVEAWERLLADAGGPVCVQVLRTATEAIPLERARHLVLDRMRRLAPARRSPRPPTRARPASGPVSDPLPDPTPGPGSGSGSGSGSPQ
jgi:predicted nuclease of predicted toxin-antitoxin system